MTDLDKAREWANEIYAPSPGCQAAVEIIQSLPDQWVDVEKVREIINKMRMDLQKGDIFDQTWEQGYDDSTTEWKRHLEALVAPKLPTLAELIEQGNDPEQYRWMQARLEGSAFDFAISDPGIVESMLWAKGGTAHIADNSLITPLPGEPKLEWPGGVVDAESGDEEKVRGIAREVAEWSKNLNRRLEPEDSDHQKPNSSGTPNSSPQPKIGEWWQVEEEREGKGVGKLVENAGDYPWLIYLNDGTHDFFKRGSVTPITRMVPEIPTASDEKTSPDQAVTKDVCNNPRPEDVPADELWLVEFDGNEWVGKRNRGDEDTFTWRVASLGIKGSGMAEDSDMTLIHKLVAEPPALPEGMRLADHEEYGRMVVSPKVDVMGDYKVFHSTSDDISGATQRYVDESKFDFLDGEQHG